MPDHVGRKVKARRTSMGLTQAQLSEASGVAQGYLSQIESGARSPSLGALRKLRQALGIDDDTFVAWIDMLPPPKPNGNGEAA